MTTTAPQPASKKRKRQKKEKPQPSLTHHQAAILAVDPGEISGWAIWVRGSLRSHGTCDVFGDGPAKVISMLLAEFGPHMAVIERPFLVRFGNQTNIGTADRIWRKRLEEASLERRTIRVYPATWRSRSLGKGWSSAKRDDVRTEEMRVATKLVDPAGAPLHPDTAAAILIGKWGCFAGEVLAKLPKRRAA